MSALAKPFIAATSHATLVSAPVVPAEEIVGVDKNRESGGSPGTLGFYSIVFRLKSVNNTLREVKWLYKATAAGEAQRDTRFAAVVAALSTTV